MAEKESELIAAIKDATWCSCTDFHAEQTKALGLAADVEAERDRYRGALERVTEAYDDPKKMVGIAWEALDD